MSGLFSYGTIIPPAALSVQPINASFRADHPRLQSPLNLVNDSLVIRLHRREILNYLNLSVSIRDFLRLFIFWFTLYHCSVAAAGASNQRRISAESLRGRLFYLFLFVLLLLLCCCCYCHYH